MSARLMVLAAALLWSMGGVFVKSPSMEAIPLDVRGPLLVCFRTLAAGAFLSLFVRPSMVRWKPGLLPLVVAFALMNITFVNALIRTTAAAAIFLQYTATAIVAVLSWLLLRERIERSTWVSLVGAIAGIAWIVIAEQGSSRATGNLLAVSSGLAYAVVMTQLRVLREENSAWLTALCHLAAGLVALPWVLSLGIVPTAGQWGLLLFLGVFQMGLPYLLFARGVRHITATEAVLISLLEPIFNPVWVSLMWGERVESSIWIGGSLILGSLLLKYALDALSRPADKPL